MSKYILERKKSHYTFLAWLGISLLIFNVFLSVVLVIILGKLPLVLSVAILALSVLLLFLYLYLEDQTSLQGSYFNANDFSMVLMLAVIVITSVSNFSSNFSYAVRFLFLILTIFFMKFEEKLPSIIFVVLIVVMSFHMGCTFWFYNNKDFYLEHILPIFTVKEQAHLYHQVVVNNFSTGLASHYSLNGMWMAIMCTLSFPFLFYKKIDLKRILFFGASVAAILMTGKRGVLVFIAFAFVVTYFACNRSSIIKKLAIFVLAVAFSGMFIYILSFYNEGIASTLDRFFNIGNSDVSSGRFDLYKIAWSEFLKRPILGVGWREYTELVSKYYQYGSGYMDTHNVYLQLLCETGIIGFVIFVGFFISSYIKTIRLILLAKKNPESSCDKNWLLLVFSLCYQTFFLSYCMTGNPLYDVPTLYVYFFSVGFSFNISYYYSDNLETSSKTKSVSKYIRSEKT